MYIFSCSCSMEMLKDQTQSYRLQLLILPRKWSGWPLKQYVTQNKSGYPSSTYYLIWLWSRSINKTYPCSSIDSCVFMYSKTCNNIPMKHVQHWWFLVINVRNTNITDWSAYSDQLVDQSGKKEEKCICYLVVLIIILL